MFLPPSSPPDPERARPPGPPGPSLKTQGPPLGRPCRIVQIDQEKVLSKVPWQKSPVIVDCWYPILKCLVEKWSPQHWYCKKLWFRRFSKEFFSTQPTSILPRSIWSEGLKRRYRSFYRNCFHQLVFQSDVFRKAAWQPTCSKMYIAISVTLHVCLHCLHFKPTNRSNHHISPNSGHVFGKQLQSHRNQMAGILFAKQGTTAVMPSDVPPNYSDHAEGILLRSSNLPRMLILPATIMMYLCSAVHIAKTPQQTKPDWSRTDFLANAILQW